MKKAVWISYDFGLKGDYTGLYTWLDEHNAIECGHAVAFIHWTPAITGNLIEEIKKSITESVTLSKNDRLYVIWKEGTSVKGEFINGSRKQPQWQGYSNVNKANVNDSGK